MLSILNQQEKICDAVFEGGGMRGIGLVGAVARFEADGYKFRYVAGSSAGAIVASLVAAGFSAAEIHDEMAKVDFEKFKQPAYAGGKLGALGLLVGATKNLGIYSAALFETWLSDLLKTKGVVTFGDIDQKCGFVNRLRVTASDITDEKTLILPGDLANFNINPSEFPVATAVRMSMGIPVFYEPYELTDTDGGVHYIVDGGMLSNYPIWILDDGHKRLDVPVFGFRFIRHRGQTTTKKASLINYIKQILQTLAEAHDDEYHMVLRGDLERTIYIDTLVDDVQDVKEEKKQSRKLLPRRASSSVPEGKVAVGITDFNLTRDKIENLYNNGTRSADEFLRKWNFERWRRNRGIVWKI